MSDVKFIEQDVTCKKIKTRFVTFRRLFLKLLYFSIDGWGVRKTLDIDIICVYTHKVIVIVIAIVWRLCDASINMLIVHRDSS